MCAYDRGQLLALYTHARPDAAVVDCLRSAGLWIKCRLYRTHCFRRRVHHVRQPFDRCDRIFLGSYRGCRSGRSCRLPPVLRSVGNGAAVIVGNRPSRRVDAPRPPRLPSSLIHVHVDRHSTPPGKQLVCGCLNVRSLANKVDDVLDLRRAQLVDVLFLIETWHDSDSVCLRRLRVDGFQIVDRPRPRSRADTLATNHGGIAVVAVPGVRLSMMDLGVRPATFELLCVRVASGASSFIAAAIYRPGSARISSSFYVEMSDALDRLASFVEPILLTGDINFRLDRSTDPDTRLLVDMLASRGLARCATAATHDLGGALDIVALRADGHVSSSTTLVDVIDVRPYFGRRRPDHRLLRWTMPLTRPSPVYSSTTGRSWSRLDANVFRGALRSSQLCRPESWTAFDLDALAQLYDEEVVRIVDGIIPVRTVRCMRRSSDPWFDDDCRAAKSSVRYFERRARRADPTDATAAAAATAAWTARRREYRDLLQQKRQAFWRVKIDAERSTPRQLWRSIDTLMGRGRSPASGVISAEEMHRFFDAKVAGVRASTDDDASSPSFSAAPPGCVLRIFRPLTVVDIVAAVQALPDKQCMSDPMPTRLLKDNVDALAPFLVELFNRSLALGVVPSVFKSAYITPLLKKADLDPADAKSYRPISNLTVLSKLLERLVARQLIDYLTTSKLLPRLQSAYRAHHSTETAVLKVLADILRVVDGGDLALLTLLDLSAAFDTVDHVTLLRRLETSYGLKGPVHGWFVSYLSGRSQSVRRGSSRSTPIAMLYGVPQGSVLGPILFLLYTADLLGLIESHGLQPHLYADDTQIYGFCPPDDTVELQRSVSACIDDVGAWMRSNRLQLNTSKTEVLWCTSAWRQHQIPHNPLMVSSDLVTPVESVRDLGIYLDSDLTMRTHITRTVSSCFAVLRQIRSISRSVSRSVLQSLIVSLVLSRLDYGCATLAGLPACSTDRLQSVLNAAARLVFGSRKYDHVTPLLRDLHWLRVPERIEFRLAVLAYRCLNGLAPPYLADELHRVADDESRRRLRSASTAELLVPRTEHSMIGDRAFPVAAARVWNDLPAAVTSSPSLQVFRRRLKTELFIRSYGPDLN